MTLSDFEPQIVYWDVTEANKKYEYPQDFGEGPYFMENFIKDGQKNADCAEMIVDKFENLTISSVTITDNNVEYICTEYTWEHPILKMIGLDGDQIKFSINCKDRSICYRECKTNNKENLIYFKTDDGTIIYYFNCFYEWKEKFPLEFQPKRRDSVLREVGTFYIVQDRNYFNFTKENVVYPIDHGIKNANKLDRMEWAVASRDFVIDADVNLEMYNNSQLSDYDNINLKFYLDPFTMKPFQQNCTEFTRANGTTITGSFARIKKGSVYYKWTRDVNNNYSLGKQIIVDADHYPGFFKLVGETYSRRRDDGIDERLQFEIPLCKMSAKASLQLQAEGDPTVYDFSLQVMKPKCGPMMKLTQYKVKKDIITSIDGERYCSNSTSVIPQEKIPVYNNCCPTPEEIEKMMPVIGSVLEEFGVMDVNREDLIPFYTEVKSKVIDALIERGIYKNSEDLLPPVYEIPKPLDAAFFSVAARRWLIGVNGTGKKLTGIDIILPEENTVYIEPRDFTTPYDVDGEQPYLQLPQDQNEVDEWLRILNNDNDLDKETLRNKLLIALIYDNDTEHPEYLYTNMQEGLIVNFDAGSDGE